MTWGRIRVLGQQLPAKWIPNLGASRPGAAVGYMPSETTLDPGLTAQETLRFFGELYGMPDPLIRREFNISRTNKSARYDHRSNSEAL